MKKSYQARAFTLVELLVVIAIVTALIAILLPALNRVRESAQAVTCQTQLRQVMTAALMYANDHRGWIFHSTTNGTLQWSYVFSGSPTPGNPDEYGGPKYLPARTKMAICPSELPEDWAWWNRTYGAVTDIWLGRIDVNSGTGAVSNFLTQRRPNDLAARGEFMAYRYTDNSTVYRRLTSIRPVDFWPGFGDSFAPNQPGQYYHMPYNAGGWGGIALRHSSRANLVMFDGHVEALDTKGAFDRGWRSGYVKVRGGANELRVFP